MRKLIMSTGAALLALTLALAPNAAMAVDDQSLQINRTCYPNQKAFTILKTGGPTEYFVAAQETPLNVQGYQWASAVNTTVATGFRNIRSQVFVKKAYVYEGTGAYCR